jgi:hypothetical protein
MTPWFQTDPPPLPSMATPQLPLMLALASLVTLPPAYSPMPLALEPAAMVPSLTMVPVSNPTLIPSPPARIRPVSSLVTEPPWVR